MPTSPANRLIDQLLQSMLPGDGAGRADGELLGRFVERRDEAAFAGLVRRHAPMVWGVCARALRNHHDAEDAFQATFLVLVRKAATVVPREMVANWLYGVAHQATLQARRAITRRRTREVQVADMPEIPAAQPVLSPDVQAVLDEELVRLPDIYRAVVVLCDLEGRTRKEVARQLGVPDGTVGGRLARARAMLAKRLARRGVALPAGALGTALSHHAASAGAPKAAVISTIKAASLLAAGQAAATAGVPAKVAALTEGVLKAMFVSKLKTAVSAVFILALMGTAATLLTYHTAACQENKKPTAENRVEPPAKQKSKVAAPVPKQGKEKEELAAWGKEVGGLQAGLSYQPGEKRVHRPGETVKLVVRVRNVGKEEVSFQYLRHFFIENPPTVTDDKGKAVAFKDGSPKGIYKPVDVTLEPGKEIDLYELSLTLADKAADPPQASTLYGEGKFQLQYERVLGDSMLSSVSIKTDATLRKLATGKLDLVVSKWIHRAAADEYTRFLLDLLREANGQDEQAPTQKEVKKRSFPEAMNPDFKKLVVEQDAAKAALTGTWEYDGLDEIHRWTFTDERAVNEVIYKKTKRVISKSVYGYHINPRTTPPEINFHTDTKLILGIYRQKGDHLWVAYSGAWASALVRPKGFNSEDCGLDYLPLNTMSYKRVSK